MKRRRGRPRRDLPEGIGELSDDAVAYLSEQRGEPVTREAITMLRNDRGIPPADAAMRAAWFERRGLDPAMWTPPPCWRPSSEWDGEP